MLVNHQPPWPGPKSIGSASSSSSSSWAELPCRHRLLPSFGAPPHPPLPLTATAAAAARLSHCPPVLAPPNRLTPSHTAWTAAPPLPHPHAASTPAATTGPAFSPAILVSPPDSHKYPNPKPDCNIARVRKEDNVSFLESAEKFN